MSRTLGVFLAFIGIFVAGGITGAFVALRVQPSVTHRRAAERFTQQQFKSLAEELQLTSEQRERIRPIITSSGRQIQEHRREILSILQDMETQVRAQLTEEQRSRYDVVRAQQLENLRNRRERFRNGVMDRLEQRRNGSTLPSGSNSAEKSPPAKE